jgi:hypothetical protein
VHRPGSNDSQHPDAGLVSFDRRLRIVGDDRGPSFHPFSQIENCLVPAMILNFAWVAPCKTDSFYQEVRPRQETRIQPTAGLGERQDAPSEGRCLQR